VQRIRAVKSWWWAQSSTGYPSKQGKGVRAARFSCKVEKKLKAGAGNDARGGRIRLQSISSHRDEINRMIQSWFR